MTVCIYKYIHTTTLYYCCQSEGPEQFFGDVECTVRSYKFELYIIYLAVNGLSPGDSGYFACT